MHASTSAALLMLFVSVLPGSLYTWAFEREAGSFGVALADRALRFIGISLGYHICFGWLEYAFFRWARPERPAAIDTSRFALLWVGALLYAAIPLIAGTVVGGLWASRASRKGWAWLRTWLSQQAEQRLLRVLVGRSPEPRAWDALFSSRLSAFLRLQLTDGSWVAGEFDDASYASGFPNDPDLLLRPAWSLDENLNLTSPLDSNLYISASQIRLMEILPLQPPGDRDA